MARDPTDPREDLVLLVEACGAVMRERTLREVRNHVGEDVRAGDGYVFQHLVGGPRSISELASHSGVTQQAMSKQVADLERRGLVERERNPDDARVAWIRLSARGAHAVNAARQARADLLDELSEAIGAAQYERLLRGLNALGDHLGAIEFMLERRMRPDSEL